MDISAVLKLLKTVIYPLIAMMTLMIAILDPVDTPANIPDDRKSKMRKTTLIL